MTCPASFNWMVDFVKYVCLFRIYTSMSGDETIKIEYLSVGLAAYHITCFLIFSEPPNRV